MIPAEGPVLIVSEILSPTPPTGSMASLANRRVNPEAESLTRACEIAVKTPLTVFVCSTFSDLNEEREAVLDAIRRLRLQHDSMEFFGARANQPIETCLQEVRRSNILVVIVGHRYGSLLPEANISFSEAEYSEGYALEKPCLVYIRDENVPILPKHMERDPDRLKRLEQWKKTLQTRHTVAAFQGSTDLAVQVAADLSRTISALEETGRAREKARSESSVPLLDEISKLIEEAMKVGVTEHSLLSSIRRSVSEAVSETKQLGATVFLSYASADREIVRRVANGLSKAGLHLWFDQSSLMPGADWVREIESGLDTADFIVFFISRHSAHSGSAQKELQIALHRQVLGEHGAVLLPVLLEQADVPPLLRQIHWVDMMDRNVDRTVEQLVRAIRRYNRSSVGRDSAFREEISHRAYERYLNRGPSLVGHLHYWFEAEAELDAESKQDKDGPGT